MTDTKVFKSVSPQPTVDPGGTVTVEYPTSPSMAGDTVTINFSNGEGESVPRTVVLDTDGNGTVTFTVPESGWAVVNITSEGVAADSVIVSSP